MNELRQKQQIQLIEGIEDSLNDLNSFNSEQMTEKAREILYKLKEELNLDTDLERIENSLDTVEEFIAELINLDSMELEELEDALEYTGKFLDIKDYPKDVIKSLEEYGYVHMTKDQFIDEIIDMKVLNGEITEEMARYIDLDLMAEDYNITELTHGITTL